MIASATCDTMKSQRGLYGDVKTVKGQSTRLRASRRSNHLDSRQASRKLGTDVPPGADVTVHGVDRRRVSLRERNVEVVGVAVVVWRGIPPGELVNAA